MLFAAQSVSILAVSIQAQEWQLYPEFNHRQMKEIYEMPKETLLKLLTIVVISLGIQLLFILLGTDAGKDSPKHAAIEFAQAYFQRDPHISEQMCTAYLTNESRHSIERYLQDSAEQARERGFAPYATSSMLYHIKTDTQMLNDSDATVRITGKRKTAVNRVFFMVSLIFNLGETRQVDDTLQLKKEKDHWKVCESFSDVFQEI